MFKLYESEAKVIGFKFETLFDIFLSMKFDF
jgi:hypothetical protein